jgi:DNA mismatch repair protein MutS
VNKSYIAKTYNYCHPQIQESESSFFKAEGIRHALIEHININEIYVTNDVELGGETNGILLYGTNSVGKTSLIRSIGICVILAQSGCFVPCSSFVFCPYTSIFSRIIGNDNLFKGLSTFIFEMSELRSILNYCDNGSLVLGDELCSGTENESAQAIFVSGITHLHAKRSSFIFATHINEVCCWEEIKELNRLSIKHMSVSFDRETGKLLYDRKLKEGVGLKFYGLIVCKSLYMPTDFLETAFNLRNKYFPENLGTLSHNVSSYNSKKIRGMCEICNEIVGEEIHHINQQKDADENDFIGSFHKNVKANLMSLCSRCHDKIHHIKKEPEPKVKVIKKIIRKKHSVV